MRIREHRWSHVLYDADLYSSLGLFDLDLLMQRHLQRATTLSLSIAI